MRSGTTLPYPDICLPRRGGVSYNQMAIAFGTAMGWSYNGPAAERFDPPRSLWDWFNPKYYFRYHSWYLSFHDRFHQEPKHWLQRSDGYPESYVRQMRDAGRGRLL